MADFTSIFSKCLSPDKNIRTLGESEIRSLEEHSGYAGQLFAFFNSPNVQPHLAQIAAVSLKNYVKRRWMPEDGPTLMGDEKALIKSAIYSAMLNSPGIVSSQLQECIEVIAATDFPNEWPGLLKHLYDGLAVGYLNNSHAVYSTLQTCHKLFKRYRYSFRSDELWSEIKLVVDTLFPVFYACATQLFQLLQSATAENEIKSHIHNFIPLLKVMFSLNGQDIPQQFDDTLKDWMSLLSFLLNFLPANLTDDTSLFLLKSKVLKCLTLYAQKYDEDFEPYVKNFCTAVWELLSRASGFSQYDRFVSSCLEFFRVVTFKPQIAELIHANLGVMFTNLILPNMVISIEEEDMADSSPMEFVKMFLEDANEDTRRCACGQLMKVLIKQFPQDINRLVLEQQNIALTAFMANSKANWKQMDALILLLSGVFPLLYTPRNGATTVATSQEHIVALYNNLVLPQLNDKSYPVLKTSCLKFVYVYRNQFPKDMLLDIMGKIIVFLDSDNVLLASYAAATLERMLMIKENTHLLFTKDFINSVLKQLLQNIASALQKHPRNTYIMSVFFRVIWISQELFCSFAVPACEIFISYIKQVIAEPQDSEPHFNWLLFECIALAMKWSGPSISIIQEKLEPYMALIIQRSHPDLLPYAFQIQAFFIKLTNSLSSTNSNLVNSVLPLENWEPGSRYYLPTLVIFLENILNTNPNVLSRHISPLTEIIHKLFTLGLDGQGFSLLTTLIETYPIDSVLPCLKPIHLMIFTKLHNSKSQNIRLSPKFHKGVINFVSIWILKNGWQSLAESMNSVQVGIFFMLIKGEILQNLRSLETIVERRAAILALSSLLSGLELSNEVWPLVVAAVCKVLEVTTNTFSGTFYSNGLVDLPEENTIQMTRDSFQKIYSAEILPTDKFPGLPNEKEFFIRVIFGANYPGGSFGVYFAGVLDQNSIGLLGRMANAFGISVN